MADYRTALRTGLRTLVGADGCGLVATYASPDLATVDIENVLLYNVGAGSYRHLLQAGLSLRRSTSVDRQHHVEYAVARLDDLPGFEGRAFVTFDAVVPAAGRDKPASWWAVARRARSVTGPASARFAVDVRVPRLAASTVKPLLDGVISALHAHDGSGRDLLEPRLTRDGTDLWDLATAEDAPLGRIRLLSATRSAARFDPRDDRCDAVRIRFSDTDRLRASFHVIDESHG